jgi:integrase
VDGQRFSIGDAATAFCLQSVSKTVSYCLALDEHGTEAVHRHVGREPSGHSFNELALNPKGRRTTRWSTRARLDKLLAADRHGLHERVLWRMLYETAARAEELLSLDVEDLDLEFRRGRVRSKGGAIEHVHWATGTARLLPRLLRGEQTSTQVTAGADPAARRWTR